jgi:hypothetical protein
MIITTKTLKGNLLGIACIWMGSLSILMRFLTFFDSLSISSGLALILIGRLLMQLTVLEDTD